MTPWLCRASHVWPYRASWIRHHGSVWLHWLPSFFDPGLSQSTFCWSHSSARLTSRIDARISLTASYNTPRAGWEPELLCALDRAARLAPL
ncbi:hypothetical protein [Streptomyces sp. NPDC126933]|uniref:hypothetical protein n=1 Tax=unclassified Streptomyces TaxID=2593676 RepID=UPI00364942A7